MHKLIIVIGALLLIGWAGATASAQETEQYFLLGPFHCTQTTTTAGWKYNHCDHPLTGDFANWLLIGGMQTTTCTGYQCQAGLDVIMGSVIGDGHNSQFCSLFNYDTWRYPGRTFPPRDTTLCTQFFGLPVSAYPYNAVGQLWDGVANLRAGTESWSKPFTTLSFDVTYIVWGIPPLNADFTAAPIAGFDPLDVLFTDESTPRANIVNWRWDFGDGSDPIEYQTYYQSIAHIYDSPGIYPVTLTVTDEGGRTDSFTENISVWTNMEMMLPLKQADIADWGIWDYDHVLNVAAPGWHTNLLISGSALPPAPWSLADKPPLSYDLQSTDWANLPEYNTVHFFASSNSAPVHAITPGTVTAVRYFESNDDCIQAVNPFRGALLDQGWLTNLNNQYDRCNVRIPSPITGDDELLYSVNWQNAALVSVRSFDDGTYDYVIANPTVEVGDRVDRGCVLGTVTTLQSKTALELSGFSAPIGVDFSFASYDTNRGYGTVTRRRPDLDLLDAWSLRPYMVQYPTAETKCGTALANECISRNNTFREGGGVWSWSGAVRWLSPAGVVLEPGAMLVQYLYLEDAQQHTISVQGQLSQGRAGFLGIQLGSYSETIELNEAEWSHQHTATFTADLGRAYTYTLRNDGSAPITLLMQCISNQAIELDRGACYLENHSFDYGLAGWVGGAGADVIPGAVTLTDAATISQDVDLRPGTYTLTATVRYWNEAKVTGTSEPKLSYSLAGGGWVDMLYAGKASVPYIPSSAQKIDSPMTAQIIVTEQTAGALALKFDLNGAPPELLGAVVLEICLAGVDRPYDGGTTGGPTCRVITPPMQDDFPSWIQWLWAEFDDFFQCDLMVVLNRIYTTLDNMWKLAGWQARYWMAVLAQQQGWFVAQLLPWLNGHFNNVAGGTTVQSGSSIWDVLIALINALAGPLAAVVNLLISLVEQAAALLLTVINAVIGLGLSLLSLLFGVVYQFLALFGALAGAWNNATPTPLPGLPQCGVTPKESGFCAGLWALEHTVFSGPGALIIPLLVGVGSLHLILWMLGAFKSAMVESGITS